MLENNNIQVVSKQARHRSTNMLRHMSNIMFDFFEDLPTGLPTDLPTDRPIFPVLYASLLRRVGFVIQIIKT